MKLKDALDHSDYFVVGGLVLHSERNAWDSGLYKCVIIGVREDDQVDGTYKNKGITVEYPEDQEVTPVSLQMHFMWGEE
jgi:hypothetical protein